MANWNRNDQNAYTGISAQRRNRHKTGSGQVAADSPYRRPVMPERAASINQADNRPEDDEPKSRFSPESVIYSRPEIFADPETDASEAPEVIAGPDVSAEPDTSAETVPAEETEWPAGPEISEEPEEPEEPEATEERAETKEPEEPVKPEEPGEATRAVPVTEPAAQGADSRVPPEARRMASL